MLTNIRRWLIVWLAGETNKVTLSGFLNPWFNDEFVKLPKRDLRSR